jgi:hypothetical protein
MCHQRLLRLQPQPKLPGGPSARKAASPVKSGLVVSQPTSTHRPSHSGSGVPSSPFSQRKASVAISPSRVKGRIQPISLDRFRGPSMEYVDVGPIPAACQLVQRWEMWISAREARTHAHPGASRAWRASTYPVRRTKIECTSITLLGPSAVPSRRIGRRRTQNSARGSSSVRSGS